MSERIFGIRIDDSGSVKVLNDLDSGFKKVDGSSAKVDASNKKVNASSKTLTKTQADLGSEVDRLKTRYLGVAAAGAALGATVITSIKQYAAFETAIAEVNTLLGENADIDAYSDSVRELSKQFGSTNVEQASAMYQIISAGATDAADATNILTAANKLAIGGVTDVETAADGLTSVLNAYGLASSEAGNVSDILFSTMRSGKTTIGELSTSLGKVAPIASQMGVGFDELSAAIGTITTNGVKTTEAVTQVKAALSNILKPTAEAKKLADELGINFSSAGLKANGLAGFLDIVSESTGGSSDQLATLFGSVEAVQAVMPLAGAQADKFNEILLKTKNSAGQTEEAYTIMAETLGKNFDRLKANVGDLATRFGMTLAPAVNGIIDGLEVMLDWLGEVGTGIGILIGWMGDLGSSVSGFIESTDTWQYWNKEIQESNTYLGSLADVFGDIDLVRAYFIQGALTGFENLRYGAEVAFVSLKGSFGLAIDGMSELFADFIGMIADGLDGVPFMEGAASELKKFEGSVRDSSTATEDLATELLGLKAEHIDAVKKINDTTGEMKAYALQSDTATKITDDLTDSVKDNNGAIDENTDSLDGNTDAKGDNIKATNQLIVDQEALNKKQFEALGVITSYDEQMQGATLTTEGLGEAGKEAAEKTNTYWTQATEGIQDSLGTFFRDGLDGWDSFTDSIEDLFKDMLAEMVAAWAISGIAGIFDGDSDYFDGFNMDAFTGGEGGFDVAGTLGKVGGSISTVLSSAGASISTGLTAVTSALASGGQAIAAIAASFPPVAISIAAVAAAVEIFGGGRSKAEILNDEFMQSTGNDDDGFSALGVGGGTGFSGGNLGVFGVSGTGHGLASNGSGFTAQQYSDGFGVFSGSEVSLEAFEDMVSSEGFETFRDGGQLKILGATTDQMDVMWDTYALGLSEAVSASEIFNTAIKDNLIIPSNLFLEQFAIGFGQSAVEARDSLLVIDGAFDEMTAGGMASTDALFTAISEHYGIAIEDAAHFVEQSGVSTDQWVENFTSASDENLANLLEFGANGETVFESISGVAAESALGISDRFSGATGSIIDDVSVMSSAVLGDFDYIEQASIQNAENVYTGWTSRLSGLDGYLENNVDLGTAKGEILIKEYYDAVEKSSAQDLGDYASALSGSETIGIGGYGSGSSMDKSYRIGLNAREETTIAPKGSMEEVRQGINALLDNSGNSSDMSELRGMVSQMAYQMSNMANEFTKLRRTERT